MDIHSKRNLYLISGVAILLVGIFIGSSLGNEQNDVVSEQTVAVSGADGAIPTELDIASTGGGLQLSDLVKVIRVVDGDTIDVEINGKTKRVRYIGIDTPETVDPRKSVQCFGVEASKKNKEIVEGKEVRLENDITDRDKYNRLLRYVWLGDTLVNEKLVAQGFAHSYSYPPDVKYQDKFVAAEKSARENSLGLWTACTSETVPTPTIIPPATQVPATGSSCTIKGNISSSAEKIYHVSGCGSYTKTVIEESRGERWFCSEAEAQSAGWRKALNCP